MEVVSKVEEFLRGKIKSGLFTGASVTFGRVSGERFSVHAGRLSSKVLTPVDAKTVYDLQSMTKALVTAPLYFALRKAGRLNDATKTSNVLDPAYPLTAESAADARLSQLLTHSAGFSDHNMTGDFSTAYELWSTIFTAPRHYDPGTRVEYADASYRVLGKVIEETFGESLEVSARRILFSEPRLTEIGFTPLNPFNVIGCKDAHGTIDDDHVRLLGGIVGCDGLFASSESVYEWICLMLKGHPAIGEPLAPLLSRSIFDPKAKVESFFDALSVGAKADGWEVNPDGYCYSGKFRSASTFEKSGGAGTFIWFDGETGLVCVYLTNYGKPKQFKPKGWNQLIDDVGPHELSDLIYDSRSFGSQP